MKVVQINVSTNKKTILYENLDLAEARKRQQQRIKHIYDKNKFDKYVISIEKD